jgi:hypothetical protein
MKTIEIQIETYRFDTSKQDDKIKYEMLVTQLKARGLKLLDYIQDPRTYHTTDKHIESGIYHVETKHLFNNQYNTEEGFRVFEWSEPIFPNRHIKEGYYITDCEEFQKIRGLQNTIHKCHYCGKQYEINTKNGYCDSCFDSQYLRLSRLHLLELTPISEDYRHNKVPKYIIDRYNNEQRAARLKRAQKDKADMLQSLKNKVIEAQKEYDIHVFLIENDIDIDNVIYYSRSKTVCFGWRDSLSSEEQQELKTKLENISFPYKYQFK